LRYLADLWDPREAASFEAHPLERLRYRSNVLGADLRITNFGGGNTSSKIDLPDPLTGRTTRVLAVKGSGGDLRSITAGGFALLYLDKLEQLIDRYSGEAHEDAMVDLYPMCAFGPGGVAASIDTPLHAFLPAAHVDHLHPDWAIALAASANGRTRLDEFNARYGRRIVWVPWQRPGFELALMLRRAAAETAGCDGIVLGGHGLFTWGDTERACYLSSVTTIDQMGQFVADHAAERGRQTFGGVSIPVPASFDRQAVATAILPALRGAVSSNRRTIAHWDSSNEARAFAESRWAEDLCRLGTSCPDHFLRTRISPMFIPWDPVDGPDALVALIEERVGRYRVDYAAYYRSFATASSPALRDSNPSVVVVPGLGIFGFARDKREARISTEFYRNAINVMSGANALEGNGDPGPVPQAKRPDLAGDFASFHNYVALPRSEAFRIEYWALEEAKLQRMQPEREFSRKIALVVGGGSGIGRETVLELAKRGAHIVVADLNAEGATEVATEAARLSSPEAVFACALNLGSRESVQAAVGAAVRQFGGLDVVINTAAVYPTPAPQREWATLIRHRAELVGQRTRLCNRIHAQLHLVGHHLARGRLLTRPGQEWLRAVVWPALGIEARRVVRTHFRLIAHLTRLRKALDRRIAHVAPTLPEARLLETVPGIGPYRALLLCAECVPIHRFATPSRLVSYAGLAPRSSKSGQRPVRTGPIPAGANRWVRGTLVRAVVQHVRHAPHSWLTQYYVQQKARLGWPVARVATARKLARAIHAMLTTGSTWQMSPGRGELLITHAAPTA
jgi:rhamnose utilization protein RhaD (predicted bifunctional aldolase and dehydrogenase)/NAD(P)-dependent dehydrogenase (short-subunit alcohol dehydrogenase family)